jgi:N-acetylglucosaminyldiphosphoundecaprenol N-acetyl-beta-D-mannosaminyltransferase
LGVGVDNCSKSETRGWLKNALGNPGGKKFVATLNPEIILKGYRDKRYGEILNSADLGLCDGFGIRLAGFLKGKRIKSRNAGVDLANFLLEEALLSGLRVLVVAAKNSLSSPEEIKRAVLKKCPNLDVEVLFFQDEEIFFQNDSVRNSDIVFVNFGAPKQELFIFDNRDKFLQSRILIGVGGTFDFFTGKMRRAPKVFRKIGLEWLWRFLQEPRKRAGRIYNAVIVFPLTVLFKSN